MGLDVHLDVWDGTPPEHHMEHYGFVHEKFGANVMPLCRRRNPSGLPTARRYDPVSMQLEQRMRHTPSRQQSATNKSREM